MLKHIFTTCIILACLSCFGQKNKDQVINPADTAYNPNDPILTAVEVAPEYIGGDKARIKFLGENILYPQMARESGIQGTVYVTFVVEKSGRLNDVRVLRGIGGGCDEETVRVIRAMPRWKAGMQGGKPQRVQYNMPIKYTLASGPEKKDKKK